jgi:hypothetical protein
MKRKGARNVNKTNTKKGKEQESEERGKSRMITQRERFKKGWKGVVL